MVRKWEKVVKRLPSHDGGKGVGLVLMKERGQIADSGVSATEKSQKCGTVVIQQWRQVKSAETVVFHQQKKVNSAH
jgi:hypothetical protein